MTNKLKILVITDNPGIARRFELEVWPLVDENLYELSFCCSPFLKPDDFNLTHSISAVDLRNHELLSSLFQNYLILSLHCKQLFPRELIKKVRCINIHPGFNPINRGWYPQVFAIVNDLDIGATIHEIDEKLDHGQIVVREKIKKYNYDTSLTLYSRIVDLEIKLLKENIKSILNGNYKTIRPESEGNLFLKKDFNELCRLKMDENVTMKQAIDRLRALTHGDFKNAYFLDDKGKKIFVSINLEHE